MKVNGTQNVVVEINEDEIAYAIMGIVFRMMGCVQYDDAGCDWFTSNGITYIGGKEWMASKNPKVASLIDAFNIIRYGKKLELEES